MSNHSEVRSQAYSLLLSNSSSINSNRFASTFEQEGLFGLTYGVAQAVASAAIHTVTGFSHPQHNEKENQLVTFAFAQSFVNVILEAMGFGCKQNDVARSYEEFDLPVDTPPLEIFMDDESSPISAQYVLHEETVNDYEMPPMHKDSIEVTKIALVSTHDVDATKTTLVSTAANVSLNNSAKENTTHSHLIVLVSNGVADYNQAAAQKATLQHLDDFRLPYQTLDGMDTSQQLKRNELFGISGIRGNYPQLFVCENGHYTYLGGYSWLQEQTIQELINICGGQKLMSTSGKSLDCQSSNLGSPCFKKSLTVLISNGVADFKQASNQKSALRLLTDLNLPYNTVDGMDVNQKEKRNEMFDISGIRGNYPQIFVEDGEMLSFLGGFDWLECQSDADFNILLG